MDKLECYLDSVCRGIAGPRSLRQHIRLELREHLLDAAAEHREAGLTADEAPDRAIEHFGGPEQLRLELEAMHGHRLLTVVIDKAMQWKEATMRARWLWTTIAHFILAAVIAVEVACIAVAMLFIVPAYVKMEHDGLFDVAKSNSLALVEQADSWLMAMVRVANHFSHFWWLWAAVAIVVWGLFEWRLRSDNKSFMRLSGLGTAALVLAVAVGVTAWGLIVPFVVSLPSVYHRSPEPIVREAKADVEAAIGKLEQSLAANDWQASRKHAEDAQRALGSLTSMGGSAPALLALDKQPKLDDVRAKLDAAWDSLRAAHNAILKEDSEHLHAAMQKYREAYGAAIQR